jgi:hypothetical protein
VGHSGEIELEAFAGAGGAMEAEEQGATIRGHLEIVVPSRLDGQRLTGAGHAEAPEDIVDGGE